MKQSTDIIIISGGIVGCSIAYSLCKRGKDVVILDRGEIGAQSSSAASGLLAPLRPFAKPEDAYTQVLVSCLARFPTLIEELEEQTGIFLEYSSTGTLRLFSSKNYSRLERWTDMWRQADFPLKLVCSDELKVYDPELNGNTSIGVYNPCEPQLNAIRLVQAYAAAATMLGAIFYPHEEAISIQEEYAKVQGVSTLSGKNIACNHLVIATGVWSHQWSTLLQLTLPIYPLRGQNIALAQPSPSLQHILFGNGIYLAPKPNGDITIGTVRDEAGFATETTQLGIQWLYENAVNLLPRLKGTLIKQAWAGLLPKAPDNRPLLGAAPSWENVTLACGHNGFGLLLAPLSEVIAEEIVSGQQAKTLEPFHLERFLNK